MSETETPAQDPAPAAAPAKTGWRAKLEALVLEYGSIAIVVYLAIWLTTWAGFALALATGLEVDTDTSATGVLGVLGAAWVPTKLTQPLRIAATLVVTPLAATLWHRVRGRPKP